MDPSRNLHPCRSQLAAKQNDVGEPSTTRFSSNAVECTMASRPVVVPPSRQHALSTTLLDFPNRPLTVSSAYREGRAAVRSILFLSRSHPAFFVGSLTCQGPVPHEQLVTPGPSLPARGGGGREGKEKPQLGRFLFHCRWLMTFLSISDPLLSQLK